MLHKEGQHRQFCNPVGYHPLAGAGTNSASTPSMELTAKWKPLELARLKSIMPSRQIQGVPVFSTPLLKWALAPQHQPPLALHTRSC